MSNVHPDRHAGWLREWHAEGRLDDVQCDELLACTHCAAEAGELAQVLEALDSAAEEVRKSDLESDQGDAPGQDEAEAEMRRLMGEPRAGGAPGVTSGWMGRLGPWLAVAAALVAALLLYGGDKDDGPADSTPIELAEDKIELIRPLGEVSDHERFEWRCGLAGIGYYELRIWDAKDRESEERFETYDSTPTWIATDEIRASLPRQLRWQVLARGDDGEELGRSEVGESLLSSD